jgi:predicted DsbA family dithiol-disulfide isomerase
MAGPLLIEIASDVVCPWCFIGKRRLEKALAQSQGLAAIDPPEELARAIRAAVRT